MFKLSDLTADTELQPQQSRVRDAVPHVPGMLVYHGLGSGKTLNAIAAGDQFTGLKNVIVPASLRTNFQKELRKYRKGPSNDFKIQSYNSATSGQLDPAALNIFDEAHRMGQEGTALADLHKKIQGRSMLLTGTPIRNNPTELVPLMKMIAGDRNIPQNAEQFKRRFIREEEVSPGFWGWLKGVKPGVRERLTNRDELKGLLEGRVDYHPSRGEFPSVKHQDIDVDMSKTQHDLYNGILGKNPWLAYKVRSNLPPSKAESKQLNSFLSGTRQVSNNPSMYDVTMRGDPIQHSPKLQRMLSEIQQRSGVDPNFKSLVYSNYLDSGIKPMSDELSRRGISNAMYSGGLSDAARKKIVDDYNQNKIRALLVSGAGAEGLDLKGTRMVQIMEPYWNEARVKQVIGRAVRNRSHASLPEDQRNVLVQRFYSKPRQGLLARWGLRDETQGSDRYMRQLSNDKQQLNDELLQVLKEVGSQGRQNGRN